MNIHPGRTVKRISKERKIQLFQEIVIVLLDSIENGGSSISDYRNINGEAGTMQNRLTNVWQKGMWILWHENETEDNWWSNIYLLPSMSEIRESTR